MGLLTTNTKSGLASALGSCSGAQEIENLLNFDNVLKHGADPTGNSDSVNAFNSAGRALSALGGGTLYIPTGTYLLNSGSVLLYENVVYQGASQRGVILKSTTGTHALLKAVNADTGRSVTITVRDLKLLGHTGITDCIVNLTGASYVLIDNVDVQGNPTLSAGTADAFKFPIGSAVFNGYHRYINCYALYVKNGLYGQCNQLQVLGGFYNHTTEYGIQLYSSYGMTIYGPEVSYGGLGGIKIGGQNCDISGCWHEGNPTRLTGVYSPNNVDTSGCVNASVRMWNDGGIAGVNIGRHVFGTALLPGHEFGNAVTGNGDISTSSVLYNGSFTAFDTVPLGWSTSAESNATYSIQTSSLPAGDPRVTRSLRTTWVANFPYCRQTLAVVEGETITIVGWVKSSSGMTNVRFGIANLSNTSQGKFHTATEPPAGTWVRYFAQWTIPAGVSFVYVGLVYCAGTTTTVDYCEMAAVACFRGQSAFYDGDARITSTGGRIYGQNLYLGDRRHGYGSTAPASGTYEGGEITYNTATQLGDPALWVCTTSGSPGTHTPVAHAYPTASQTWNPGDLAAGASETVNINCTGAAMGDPVVAGFGQSLQNMRLDAWVSSAGVVTARVTNGGGSNFNLGSNTIKVIVLKR